MGERIEMPLPPRLFPGDEELGKRDDDHRPGTRGSLGMTWNLRQVLNAPHRRTMRRVALAIIAVAALYYFFKNMPTDLQNPRPRPHYGHLGIQSPPISGPKATRPASPGSTPGSERGEPAEPPQHDFNGPIKFYELATTLLPMKHHGSVMSDKNVVCLSWSF
jgi:hypothetical protein